MFYVTSEPLLNQSPELLGMLRRTSSMWVPLIRIRLQRDRELHHRILTAEAVARHTLFRQKTRRPGY